jgi:hypothetical protein
LSPLLLLLLLLTINVSCDRDAVNLMGQSAWQELHAAGLGNVPGGTGFVEQ